MYARNPVFDILLPGIQCTWLFPVLPHWRSRDPGCSYLLSQIHRDYQERAVIRVLYIALTDTDLQQSVPMSPLKEPNTKHKYSEKQILVFTSIGGWVGSHFPAFRNNIYVHLISSNSKCHILSFKMEKE